MMLEANAAAVLLAALMIDALMGDPDWLWRRAPHPVVGFGWIITRCERVLNDPNASPSDLRIRGAVATIALLLLAVAAGLVLAVVLRTAMWWPFALAGEALVAAVFIAQRSLYEHVERVGTAFRDGGLCAAREAVSMIVGRDPQVLDEAGVVRASIETTAENFSDGVTAPALWFLLAGVPGLLAYKALNTADSMIGHLNARYRHYGWFAARADDVANWIPARISGCLIVIGAATNGRDWRTAWRTMLQDARKHKSPNAGWPEAAMAGALGVALAGPRVYSGETVDDPWLHQAGDRQPTPVAIGEALRVYVASCAALALCVAMIAAIAATAPISM